MANLSKPRRTVVMNHDTLCLLSPPKRTSLSRHLQKTRGDCRCCCSCQFLHCCERHFATKLRSYLAGRTTMEAGVLTPKSHRWRTCRQSEASTAGNAAQDSSVPSEMFQTTLSRLNARKLPTTPLPLMDKVVARFMNISPEQWERVNSAIKFLNDHFKDDSLSWLTVRWLVASHPEQFLPAPYNSYEELLENESETKLAIENATKEAGRWRESCHRLQAETKAWQNKLNKVEAEIARLTLAAKSGSAHNTAMARDTTVRRPEALQPGTMAVSKGCEIGPFHIHCRRAAKSQRSKGTAIQKQESAFGQFSTEAESEQRLFHKDIDTKQKRRLPTKATQHPSTHDEQEPSSKMLNHPVHNCTEQYTGDTNSFSVANMRSNGSSSNMCTTTTTKTTTTTSYATVSTNEGKDRHSISSDSVGLNKQEGTVVQNSDDPAVMVEKPSAAQVLNRVQDILRCMRGVRSEDHRKTLPSVAPCGSKETDSARTSTSGPNVEVLYVQYNQQKGRRDRHRDISGLAPNSPNASRSPMLCQQDRSVRKPSTKPSRTKGFSVTAVDRLLELKQTGSLTEYSNRFMNQFSKGTDIPESVAVRVFLENLLPDFRKLTVDKRPETLADAIRLAYQVEQAILEKQDRLPGCGHVLGVAIHLQDSPAVAGRCGQFAVVDTVENSHASPCDVEMDSCMRSSSTGNGADTNLRLRSQRARTPCQTSSGHYHNVSYHEAASFKELSEGVSPTGSSVCLNSHSSDEVMGDEDTLRQPATSDSRTTPVTRRSTIAGGEGEKVAEATFSGLADNCTPKARRNSKSSTSICSIQQLQHIVPGSYRGRTAVSVEQPTRSDKRERAFSTSKQCHTSVVSSASVAPFASFKSSSSVTETQSDDSFVSTLGSSTESTQAVGNLRTAESSASVWRGNVSNSSDGCEDTRRSCRAESGEFSDSRHQGERQVTDTRSPSPQGGAEALSTAHLPQKNSTVRKSFGSRVAFDKQKNEGE
ncbi:hypothetical protein TGRUB_211280 [Toxoplasma gondii RUB]|uniref:Uncharacterized protein n=1 Tax=Toxoplasma gondii RUB TaxID=935652 RepID=A0A086LMJ3_TOXGO|nr:hypothetical protein TGRUB_211280 [Toxoplasma gondii RUB]